MEGLESFFTASQQLKLFVLSCAFGIPIGIFFDIFRAIRIIFPHGKFIVALEDILFFISYAVFLMCFTITAARSEFRFYFCAGNLLGFIIYYFTVGNTVVAIFKKIVTVFKKGIYIVLRPINTKIVLLHEKNKNFIVKRFKNMPVRKKNTKTPLIVRCNLLYNKKNNRKNNRKNVKSIEKQTGKT